MTPYSTPTRPNADRTVPTGSSRGLDGSRLPRTRKRPAASATITTGTFTKKTEPHQKCWRRYPPMVGPTTMPRPETPAQIPIACPRSSDGNSLVRIDRVAAMMMQPPTPARPRAAISSAAEPENADATDPKPNTTSPTVNARFRPNLSPRLPDVSRRLAYTIV